MLTLTIPPHRDPVARITLIGACAVAGYLTYASWGSSPPPPMIWPDIADPIGQLQYAVVILALIVAVLIGELRRMSRRALPSLIAPTSLPAKRIPLTNAERFAIFKRDGYCCQLCGRTPRDGMRLEVDHKRAVANGGTNDPRNLWTLCQQCNNGKSDSVL